MEVTLSAERATPSVNEQDTLSLPSTGPDGALLLVDVRMTVFHNHMGKVDTREGTVSVRTWASSSAICTRAMPCTTNIFSDKQPPLQPLSSMCPYSPTGTLATDCHHTQLTTTCAPCFPLYLPFDACFRQHASSPQFAAVAHALDVCACLAPTTPPPHPSQTPLHGKSTHHRPWPRPPGLLQHGRGASTVLSCFQGLRINVDLVLRRSVLTLKLWKC